MSCRDFFTFLVLGIDRIDTVSSLGPPVVLMFVFLGGRAGKRWGGRVVETLCLLSYISIVKILFKSPLIYACKECLRCSHLYCF